MPERTTIGPDFIGVGVQRAGTSWLYECLKEHQDIFLPGKELHFFNKKYDKGIDWYYSLFDKEGEHKIAGEFTPDYMFSEFSIQQIAEHCPKAKIIIILRDPFERAFSAYNLFVAHGKYEKGCTFQEAMELDSWIIDQSLYYNQLARVYSLFDKEQIKVYDFDDISNKPLELLKDVYEFLGVDSSFKPSRFDEKYNVSGMSGIQNKLNIPHLQKSLLHSRYGRHLLKLKKFKMVRKFKSWLLDRGSNVDNKAKHCSPELRLKFKEDLANVSELVNKNFEKWY